MERNQSPRLIDRVRARCRVKHYSYRTDQTYVQWIRRLILFHGKRHPSGLAATEIEAFLTDLAVNGNVAASTRNQALSAILFLYREVLGTEFLWLDNMVRAKGTPRVSVVLTRDEVCTVFANLDGVVCIAVVQRATRKAVRRSGIRKSAGCVNRGVP